MMRQTIALAVIFVFSALAFGQVKPTLVPGEVVSVGGDKIVIMAASGKMDIPLSEKTEYKRVSAGKISFAAATPAAFSDIAVGDKVIASIVASTEGKPLPARTIYVMTKADIAQKHAKEAAEWRTRGIAGRVTSIDQATKAITVQVGGGMSTSQVIVTANPNARILRYPIDSISFADAQPSTLADVKAGDQIQALGDRSADGAALTAEAIVTGAFRQVVGVVQSVDASKNEVVIKDDATGKDVTVSLAKAVMLKRFSPELVGRMAALMMDGGVRPPGQAGPPQGGQGKAPAPPAGARGGGLNEMVERAPTIAAADLANGEMIAVLISVPSATADYGTNIRALKLVAGVEPFKQLAARMAATPNANRGQQGVSGNFTIPGLDGSGFQ